MGISNGLLEKAYDEIISRILDSLVRENKSVTRESYIPNYVMVKKLLERLPYHRNKQPKFHKFLQQEKRMNIEFQSIFSQICTQPFAQMVKYPFYFYF